MKTGRTIILALLVCALLIGQIPHNVQYCRIIQRSIDTNMMQCCQMSYATTDKHIPRFVSSAKMMMVLIKPTVSVFQKNNHGDQYSGNVYVEATFYPTSLQQTCSLQFSDEAEHPPPDIVIRDLNLRI